MELEGINGQLELIILHPGQEVGPRTWDLGVNQAPMKKDGSKWRMLSHARVECDRRPFHRIPADGSNRI